jgi:hypothetical protein
MAAGWQGANPTRASAITAAARQLRNAVVKYEGNKSSNNFEALVAARKHFDQTCERTDL